MALPSAAICLNAPRSTELWEAALGKASIADAQVAGVLIIMCNHVSLDRILAAVCLSNESAMVKGQSLVFVIF